MKNIGWNKKKLREGIPTQVLKIPQGYYSAGKSIFVHHVSIFNPSSYLHICIGQGQDMKLLMYLFDMHFLRN